MIVDRPSSTEAGFSASLGWGAVSWIPAARRRTSRRLSVLSAVRFGYSATATRPQQGRPCLAQTSQHVVISEMTAMMASRCRGDGGHRDQLTEPVITMRHTSVTTSVQFEPNGISASRESVGKCQPIAGGRGSSNYSPQKGWGKVRSCESERLSPTLRGQN